MGTFTMRLQEVFECTDDIGLDAYPIFDESYRATLNQKIIDHYWNQEIGQETIEMFRFAVRRHMNEQMPMFNQLYKSELLKVDPFLTFKTVSTSTSKGVNTADGTSESTATNTSESDGKSRTVASELPQTRLGGDKDYATQAQDTTSNSTGTGGSDEKSASSQTGSQEGETESESSGFSGSQAELLLRFRETFLNVDLMVIESLVGLFMLVWDNGDSYTRQSGYSSDWGY